MKLDILPFPVAMQASRLLSFWTLGVAQLTLTFAVPAAESQINQVRQLAPDVYFHEGDIQGHGHCNNGWIIFEDYVLVVDGIEDLAAHAARAHEATHPEQAQLVRDGGLAHAGLGAQLVYAALGGTDERQEPQARGIGQAAEHRRHGEELGAGETLAITTRDHGHDPSIHTCSYVDEQ